MYVFKQVNSPYKLYRNYSILETLVKTNKFSFALCLNIDFRFESMEYKSAHFSKQLDLKKVRGLFDICLNAAEQYLC